MKTPTGPKELALRAMKEARAAKRPALKAPKRGPRPPPKPKKKLHPYAGKPLGAPHEASYGIKNASKSHDSRPQG